MLPFEDSSKARRNIYNNYCSSELPYAPQESYAYNTKLEWTVENEELLVEWADIAQCYNWLNMESFKKYKKLHMMFTIPTISLSTLTGTAAFAISNNLTPELMIITARIVGTVNIIVGILSTIQQYLKISELKEQYRSNSIAWGKFARNIRIELIKAPQERMSCSQFLKMSRNEFDRLMETTPYISNDVIQRFIQRFQGERETEQRRMYEELKKPDICDVIVSTNVSRNKWYMAPDHVELPRQFKRKDNSLRIHIPPTLANSQTVMDRWVNSHSDKLANRVIEALQDTSSISSKEIKDAPKQSLDRMTEITKKQEVMLRVVEEPPSIILSNEKVKGTERNSPQNIFLRRHSSEEGANVRPYEGGSEATVLRRDDAGSSEATARITYSNKEYFV
jgi:hypothetical protein